MQHFQEQLWNQSLISILVSDNRVILYFSTYIWSPNQHQHSIWKKGQWLPIYNLRRSPLLYSRMEAETTVRITQLLSQTSSSQSCPENLESIHITRKWIWRLMHISESRLTAHYPAPDFNSYLLTQLIANSVCRFGDKLYERHIKGDFTTLAAMLVPEADKEGLRILTDWFNWVC
jgi:hypothetical protein